MYSSNFQAYRSIKVSSFSMKLTQTPPGPATIRPDRTNLTTDNDMSLPIYAKLYLIKHTIDFRQEAGVTLKLLQIQ